MSETLVDKGDGLPLVDGARIVEAYWGEYPVYKSEVQGSTYTLEIESIGGTLRLINPLVKGNNSWEGVFNDILIDWGDGTETREYGVKFNSGRFNRDSSYKIEHTYANANQRYTITVTSVEPLLPIGCKLYKILGTLPEDYYVGNELGLLTFASDYISNYPELEDLENHKNTITEISGELLDLWVNTTNMDNTFANWITLSKVGAGIFKDNIKSKCTSYIGTFKNTPKLTSVDDDLLRETNNVVQFTTGMFEGSGVTNTINLINSSSLLDATNMYANSKVSSYKANFLSNASKLKIANGIFKNTLISRDDNGLLVNATNLISIDYGFKGTKIVDSRINLTKWSKMESMVGAYSNIRGLRSFIGFSGDFAKNIINYSLNLSEIFKNSGTDLVIKSDTFEVLKSTHKLDLEQDSWFNGSNLRIEAGALDNLFIKTEYNGSYRVTNLLKNATITDKNLLNFMKGNSGIVDFTNSLSNIDIDFIDRDFFFDMINLENITDLYNASRINFRFRKDMFRNNRKISNWTRSLSNVNYKYTEYYSIDNIIYSDVNIDITNMFTGSNIHLRSLLDISAKCANINASNFIGNNKLHVPVEVALRNKTITNKPSITLANNILAYRVYAINGETINIVYNDNTPIADLVTVKVDVGNGFETINITNGTRVVKSITSTENKLYSIKVESDVSLEIEGGELVAVFGSNSYGKDSNTDILSSETYSNVKFYDRYARIYESNEFINKLNGYIHPSIEEFAGVTSSGYRSIPEKGYMEFVLNGTGSLSFEEIEVSIYPFNVEIIDKDGNTTTKTISNGTAINNFYNCIERAIIRIHADKLIWLKNYDFIVGIYGEIPACDFPLKFKDKAPNLKRVGENILSKLTNTSFKGLFKDLIQFEYIPHNLLSRNINVVEYDEMFMNTKIKIIPDYLITNNKNDISCQRMFKGCSEVTYVREPICDSASGRINITDMFNGVSTRCWFGRDNTEVFKRLWIIGDSKLGRLTDCNFLATRDDIVCVDETTINSNRYMIAGHYHKDTFTVSIADLPNKMIYAGMGVGRRIKLDLGSSNYADSIKYLTLLEDFDYLDNTKASKEISEYIVFYNERLRKSITFNNLTIPGIKPWTFIHNDDLEIMDKVYYNTVITNQVKYDSLLPRKASKLYSAVSLFNGLQINKLASSVVLSKNKLSNLTDYMANSNISFPANHFVNTVPDRTAYLDRLCYKNTTQKETFGIFKIMGDKLNPTQRYVYAESGIISPNINEFENCGKLEDISYTFSKCTNMDSLPAINQLSKLRNLSHFAEETNISDIPSNYIYSISNNLSIDYAFSNCKKLFISNKFIDNRTTSRISIDYSLQNVYSLIGGDERIFEGLNYDATLGNHSRVIVLDEKTTFIQEIQTFKPNVSVTIRSVQKSNLLGQAVQNRYVVLWGDDSENLTQDGGTFTNKLIQHTFTTAGKYLVRILGEGYTFYVDTNESLESDVITTSIKSSFKFAKGSELSAKGLYNMFGTRVASIPSTLYENLSDKNSITTWTDMFYKFYALADIPAGIMEELPNLQNISGFWRDSYKNGVTPTRIARRSFISSLSSLNNIQNMLTNANISSVESGFFSGNNSKITSVYGFLRGNKLTSLPLELLYPLANLATIEEAFANNSSLVLDNTYVNFLSKNINLTNAKHAFVGCTIKSIPKLLSQNTKLTDIEHMFATNRSTDAPWNNGSSNFEENNYVNDWTIPEGFLSTNKALVNINGLFAGRKSCIDYPQTLLSSSPLISKSAGVFYKTGLTTIKENTISNFTSSTVDVRYMFANTVDRIRNCPKVIKASLPPTFSTYKMLDGVYGKMSEREMFSGIRTTPTDIQSFYRQEFEWFIMTTNIDTTGKRMMTLPENVFPLTDYVFDVDWGDGTINTFAQDFNTLSEFENVVKHTYGQTGIRTVRVKSPFLTVIKNSKITSISGVIGKMRTNNHVIMKNVGFGSLESVEEIDYRLNTHLTSLADSFRELPNLVKVRSEIFDKLVSVTSTERMYYNSTKYTISENYTPNYNHMKLTSIASMYEGCKAVWNSKWNTYNPLSGITTITNYSRAFYKTNMNKPTNIVFGNNANISYIYAETPINNVPYNYLNGNIKDYSYAFYKCANFNTISGETSSMSLLSGTMGSSSDINLSYMFSESGLNSDSINTIVSNMSVLKNTATQNINMTHFASNLVATKTVNDRGIEFRINTSNKTINFSNSFTDSYISNIPVKAVITNNCTLNNIAGMFRNCFGTEDLIDVNSAFKVTPNTGVDYRITELDTVNIFNVKYSASVPINLVFAGLSSVTRIRYIKLSGSINKTMINIPLSELANLSSTGNNIIVRSTELVMPSGDNSTTVSGKLSTNKSNYVMEGFNFGTYFSTVSTFDIELGGSFHVRTSSGSHTFNGLFKGLKNVQSYSETLFRSYFNGTDGTAAITETKETFAENLSLRTLPASQLQYLPFLTSVRHMFKGDKSIEAIPVSYFNKQTSLYDWYGVFEDCDIPGSGLPSRLIKVF